MGSFGSSNCSEFSGWRNNGISDKQFWSSIWFKAEFFKISA